MGRELKAWNLAETILGKRLTDRLRNGEPIQISASNGEVYEIDPVSSTLLCLTRKERYCVHPKDTMDYPFGDMVVLWWTFLHNDPERLEAVVGSPSEGHCTPMELERFGMAHGCAPDDIITAMVNGMQDDPLEMFGRLPTYVQDIAANALTALSQLFLNGDIEINWR